jgi:hypothetical protein
MASEFKIGRLRYTWAGAWVTGQTYNRDAVVSFNGKTWVCLQPHTADDFYEDLTFFDPVAGALPRWELMIDGKTWRGAWAPATTYFPGNIVLYEGQVYLALSYNVSGSSLNTANWSVLATTEEWSAAWTINT